jgi:hypothetical protein
MGYFSGKGLPFFGFLIPGTSKPNFDIAGFSYKIHGYSGTAL